MGVFARLSELITANVNALLDKAENPERMLAQVIREMEEGLAAARGQGASALAAERRLQRELDLHRGQSGHWQDQARRALGAGREDLARQALACKIEHDDLVRALEPQCLAAGQTSGEVRRALGVLEARLTEARRQQRLLLARQRVAQVRLEAQRCMAAVALDTRTPFTRFARFEEKLIDLEDHLLAQAEVIRGPGHLEELAELELTRRINKELELLKEANDSTQRISPDRMEG